MKVLKLLLTIILCVVLVGCGSNKENDIVTKDISSNSTEVDENKTNTEKEESNTTEQEQKKESSSGTNLKKDTSSSGSTSSSTTKKDDNKKNSSSSGSSSSSSSSSSTSTTKPSTGGENSSGTTTKPSTGTGSSSSSSGGNTTTTPPKEETPKPTPPPTPTWAMSESQMISYSKSIVSGLGFDWDEPSTKDNSGWFAPKTISITMNEDKIKEIIKMSINATCRKLDPKQGGVKGYFEKKDDNTFMFYTLY